MEQLKPLLDELLSEAVPLATHPYGNYVLQHALKHGPAEHRQQLCDLLGNHLSVLGPNCYGSAVLVRALSTGDARVRLSLTRQAAATPGLLAAMARSRHGHAAVRMVLQLLGDLPAAEAAAVREALQSECQGVSPSGGGKPQRGAQAGLGRAKRPLRPPATVHQAKRSSGSL